MFTQLPKDTLIEIAEYLNYTDTKSLSKTNRNLFFSVLNEKYFKKREDKPRIPEIIQAVIAGIDTYLLHDKKHPGWEYEDLLIFDKGFHRAHCFRDILNASFKDEYDDKLKVFVIYFLLKERNGEKLKARVNQALKEKTGSDVLPHIKNYLLKHDNMNERFLEKIQDKFLKRLFKKKNDHSGNYESDIHWKEDLFKLVHNLVYKNKEEQGFMSFVRSIFR